MALHMGGTAGTDRVALPEADNCPTYLSNRKYPDNNAYAKLASCAYPSRVA